MQVFHGQRIAIIGRNGSGKSTLLKIIQGLGEPSEGTLKIPEEVKIGYVPQIVEGFDFLSGGERFQEALTQALSKSSNLLLLDEPTNHLDLKNRRSLMRMLQAYEGTLLIATHDPEILRFMDTLWHIDDGKIHVFSGNYEDYKRQTQIKRHALEVSLDQLERKKEDLHDSLMKEQLRASKSRAGGHKKIDQRKWPTIVNKAKADRAASTSSRNRAQIRTSREDLLEKLQDLRLPEIIVPKFSISAEGIGIKTILAAKEGAIGYEEWVVTNINFSLLSQERLALIGDNGSGKTTILRGILGDPLVKKSGEWFVPKIQDIGYLDQHYGTLDPQKTVLETIQEVQSSWSHGEVRRHLNDFLFRKNEEVNALVNTLSSGEKARLSLAQIAAKTPKLLILDEVTNNVDLETREHIIQVLKKYPGALLVISHDRDFLEEIGVEKVYKVLGVAR